MERYHLSTIVRLLIEEGFPMYGKGEQEPSATESEPESNPVAVAAENDQQQQLVASLSALANELIRLAGHLNQWKVQ